MYNIQQGTSTSTTCAFLFKEYQSHTIAIDHFLNVMDYQNPQCFFNTFSTPL
jgi:hypothetical protein